MPKREQRTQGEPVTKVIRDNNSLRCGCGSLLARLVPGGVELKCRRCKRQVVIPLTSENNLEESHGGASAGAARLPSE
jgi:phage FluMu protein Com